MTPFPKPTTHRSNFWTFTAVRLMGLGYSSVLKEY